MEYRYNLVKKERKKLLYSIYKTIDGLVGNEISIDEIAKNYEKNSKLVDKSNIESYINYLEGLGFIKEDDDVLGAIRLTSQGCDEVENNFPILDPKVSQTSEFNNLILGMMTNDSMILKDLEEIKEWEGKLDFLNEQMVIIKTELDKLYTKFDEEDIKNIIRDAIDSHSISKFIRAFYRLVKHPKTKKEVEAIIGSLKSSDTPKLPSDLQTKI